MTADPVTAPAELVTQDDAVLTINVSTAGPGNPLSDPAMLAGAAALREVARGEREVGAILLRGPGANFCAGGNVRDFAAAEHRPTFLREIADCFHAFINALHEADRPVVAAVKGWAAGAGMSIVTHADVAIGGSATKMRPAYRGIGLSPDGGMTWTLPRLVGAARARHIILTDPVIDAKKALAWGLLSDVVDDGDVESAARSAAEKIAAGPWRADSAARELLTRSATSTLGDQLAVEAQSISALSASAEGIEGVDAFVAKRKPDFATARKA
ncbi:enoyl-CoA hydratase-related protein [Gordonia sp. PKS22-38]|uniref:Enoyl-CoA hydratase-related protein n=1 Tax=Gordonia prachuapensis TaxID=3115651 RepID=A0ABU7MWS1_9ACTN|nr:enoyl-CoA hydratase-related protein [Gordonia sp. PKS22-38]